MASNSFGQIFRITTFGESRGEMIGVVIDGCPSGISLSSEEIQKDLDKRKPGKLFTSKRKESDLCQIVSGVYEGKTTGAPICILIPNERKETNEDLSLLKPGHASLSYLQKYGVFDPRGGGRASARETALRVAAASVAKKILEPLDIKILSYLSQMGDIVMQEEEISLEEKRKRVEKSPFFCPDRRAEKKMRKKYRELVEEKDTIGGVVSFVVENLPPCLGDPIYEKLSANLAKAIISIPGALGFSIGEGFSAVTKRGSEHNDLIEYQKRRFHLSSNHAGGILGGISTGMPLLGRVAFKPASSIAKPQKTVDRNGKEKEILSSLATNDLCIAIRGSCVVEAMVALVLADALLMHRAVFGELQI